MSFALVLDPAETEKIDKNFSSPMLNRETRGDQIEDNF